LEDDRTYAMLAKPVSSKCNLRCEYCYYQGKEELLKQDDPVMPVETLEMYVRQNLEMHGRNAIVDFAWHGGEPLTAGIDFYREAVRLQRKYGAGRKIHNSIQTNGTLLDDKWCGFLKENHFEIGVSIDGPEELHDAYRRHLDGTGTFDDTMKGIKLLQKHGIAFSALTTVNRANMGKPLEVYRFLRGLTDYIQFLPVVEKFSEDGHAKGTLASFSVTPEGYGDFLCAVWDEWIQKDVGRVNIQMFDVALQSMQGKPPGLCVHAPVCGHSGSVEANGDVYSCDRFAFPDFKIGNIKDAPLTDIMENNRNFGLHKTYGLADECFECRYLKLCFGGCPKDRFDKGKNFLCEGYKNFFSHIL